MIKCFLLFALCLVTIQAQTPTLCQNSPISYEVLEGYLQKGLSNLASPFKTLNPLIPNLDQSCKTGNVAKCGYPTKIVQNAGVSALANNPDLAYQAIVTNSSKISHPNDTAGLSDLLFQLRSDEALIYLTCTPPSQYFSYSVMLYSDGLLSATNPNALRTGILGDSLNHLRIKTLNLNGTPQNAAALIVITASQCTADKIEKAFSDVDPRFAGAVNVIALPTSFLNLGIGTDKSYITMVGRQSILTPTEQSLVTALGAASTLLFPYVRVTPLVYLDNPSDEIAKIPSWIPDYISSDLQNNFKQSEQTYEPALANAVSTIAATLHAKLPAQVTVAGVVHNVTWAISPQRSFRSEDYGEKWVMEKQSGLAGGRDTNYYAYNPVLTPVYDNTVGLGATVLVGMRHESTHWTVANPAVPTFTPSAKPHAMFWNAVWNNPTTIAAVASFNNLHPNNHAWTSLPISGGVGDPLNVLWVNAFGSATTATGAGVACGTLAALGINCVDAPATARNVQGLTILYRTYVDPATGIYPSPIKIASAQLLSIQGRLTS